MGKISEGGEWQYEKFFIHIFPLKLKKKKNRPKEKRNCCGPVWLDCGVQGDRAVGSSRRRASECPTRSYLRDLLHSDQLT